MLTYDFDCDLLEDPRLLELEASDPRHIMRLLRCAKIARVADCDGLIIREDGRPYQARDLALAHDRGVHTEVEWGKFLEQAIETGFLTFDQRKKAYKFPDWGVRWCRYRKLSDRPENVRARVRRHREHLKNHAGSPTLFDPENVTPRNADVTRCNAGETRKNALPYPTLPYPTLPSPTHGVKRPAGVSDPGDTPEPPVGEGEEERTPLERARAEQAERAGNVFGQLFLTLGWPTREAPGPAPEVELEQAARAVEPVLEHVHREIHDKKPRLSKLLEKLEAVRAARTFIQLGGDLPAPWAAVAVAIGAAAREMLADHRAGKKPPDSAWAAILSHRAHLHLPIAVRLTEQSAVMAEAGFWEPPYGYETGDLGPPEGETVAADQDFENEEDS